MRRERLITVATWNIHGCVGHDGAFDPERTGRVIRAINPDILALQEVDSRVPRHPHVDLFSMLAEAFGGHCIEAKILSDKSGHFGQLLLSRWPMQEHRVHDLSVAGREPRRALEAVVEAPAGALHVFATHLGLRAAERRHQMARLLTHVKPETRLPCLLMGDLNEWRGGFFYGTTLTTLFDGATAHRTFPARLPLFALDRILCRPSHMLRHSHVWRQIHGASDHLPVVAKIAPASGP